MPPYAAAACTRLTRALSTFLSAEVAALFDRLAEGMAEASLDPGEPRLPPLAPARGEDADLRA